MRLDRTMKIQLAHLHRDRAGWQSASMGLHFMKLPAKLFGVGRYTGHACELPQTGGLYSGGNVTYRGTEVGRVRVGAADRHRCGSGAVAEIRHRHPVRSAGRGAQPVGDRRAVCRVAAPQRHVARRCRTAMSSRVADTSVPPDINTLLAAANAGLQAIPRDNLKTVIDESYTAVGGLGPELSRIVKGSSDLAIDARKNLDPLIDADRPGAAGAGFADQHLGRDPGLGSARGHRDHAAAKRTTTPSPGSSTRAARRSTRHGNSSTGFKPTLPIMHGQSGQRRPGRGDLPRQHRAAAGAASPGRRGSPGRAGRQPEHQTGLPGPVPELQPQHQPAAAVHHRIPARPAAAGPDLRGPPGPPAGDLYCRVPQDSPFNVRGARNIPCETVPGKRAPTVKMCESDEQYVPLNDGYNWKGDPNATLSGQDDSTAAAWHRLRRSARPVDAPPAPAVAAAEYDPATGSYVGPDGRRYTQADLARTRPQGRPGRRCCCPPGS